MKLSKILTFFCIGTPICVVLRIFQIIFTIEYETGFYKNEYQTIGKAISFVIFAFCALLGYFCFKYYKSPEKPPKTNLFMSVACVGLAFITIAQAFYDSNEGMASGWQVVLIRILGVITAIYFIGFAISEYIKLPPLVHIIPCLFMIMRTAFIFINTSALAHITDNILLLATYCVVLVFFVNMAKLYNGVDIEKNFRKLLASGLIAGSLCLTQSIAQIFVNLTSNVAYLHVSNIANISTLLMGVFVFAFIISHFLLNKEI